MKKETVILGAGISGIAAGYFLEKEKNKENYNITIYKKILLGVDYVIL